jgi:hypothetical protein
MTTLRGLLETNFGVVAAAGLGFNARRCSVAVGDIA